MLDEQEKDALRQLLTLAETVRPKVLSMLTLGPRSLEHEAYAIKARVKAYDSAVDKILEKRAKRPDYGPHSLTDVVGVRILCLWPDDISRVLEKLITTVREIIGTGLSSFRDRDIAKVITEVIVYKGPNSPAIYDVIGDQLAQWFENDPADLRECVRVEPSPKDRPYSSIHFVIWCRAPVANAWASIPVEVQVRTSLEDVWSEAEHRLRYKSKSLPEGKSADIGFKLLQDLKVQLDIAASTITAARDLLTVNPPPPGSAASRISSPADPVAEFGLSSAPPEVAQTVKRVAAELEDCYRAFEADPAREKSGWLERFDRLGRIIVDAETQVVAAGPSVFVEEDAARRWRFWSRMELGQATFWQARLTGQSARAAGDETALRSAEPLAEACLRIYLDLLADNAHRGSSILWFRFGYALLDLKGDFAQALVYLKKAHELAPLDEQLPEHSPYRVTIPRLYAYCIWRIENQQFHSAVSQYGVRSPMAAVALEQIQLALDVMTPLVRSVEKVRVDDGAWNAAAERRKVYNNLISYVWDFSVRAEQATGNGMPTHAALIAQAKKATPASSLSAAYKGLASLVEDANTSPAVTTLHTLAAGALLTGNRKGLDVALARLKEGLESDAPDRPAPADEEQIRNDLALLEQRGR